MKHFPLYTQLDTMDCGATCLRMTAKYYGKEFSNQFLRESSFITREGVSMLGISEAAESIGMRSCGVKLSVERLLEVPLPAILHWNQNHFVVLYGIEKSKSFLLKRTFGSIGGEERYKFLIADPAGSKYKLTESEFTKCWVSTQEGDTKQGTALLLEPTPEFYTQSEEQESKDKKLSFFLDI